MREFREFIGLVIRAFIIATVFAAMGLATNMVSSKSITLMYEPPNGVVILGVKVPFVNEHVAHDYFGDPATSFLDTRKPEDYSESHVKGSLGLSRRTSSTISGDPAALATRKPHRPVLLRPRMRHGGACGEIHDRLGLQEPRHHERRFSSLGGGGLSNRNSRAKGRSRRAGLGERAR